jgi:hypothetical protein
MYVCKLKCKLVVLTFFHLEKLPPWRDSFWRPIAPVSTVAGWDGTTRPHQEGN